MGKCLHRRVERQLFVPALLVGAWASLAAPVSHAAIAVYTFGAVDAPTYASSDTDAASTATAFTPAAGLGSTGNWNATNNGLNIAAGTPAPEFAVKPLATTNQADAVTNNAYWSFTATPDANFAMDLTSLTFDLTVANSGARPISYFLASSLDNYATPIGGVVTAPPAITTGAKSFDLSASQFQDLTSTVEFRLYLWSTAGGGSSGSRWGFDNVTLNGSTSALEETPGVPEPTSMGLLLAAGSALLARRRPVRG